MNAKTKEALLSRIGEGLAGLSIRHKKFLIEAIAAQCEKAYRRGFQHGHAVGSGDLDGLIDHRPSGLEVAEWRSRSDRCRVCWPHPGRYRRKSDAGPVPLRSVVGRLEMEADEDFRAILMHLVGEEAPE
jgi:hypothetical protein